MALEEDEDCGLESPDSRNDGFDSDTEEEEADAAMSVGQQQQLPQLQPLLPVSLQQQQEPAILLEQPPPRFAFEGPLLVSADWYCRTQKKMDPAWGYHVRASFAKI